VSTQIADATLRVDETQLSAVDPMTLRAPGVQLLGAYEGSGFRENHFLAVRPDGQVVHLSTLLYLVLSELNPGRTAEDVSRVVSAQLDRQLTADGVNFLVTNKLAPNGLLATPGSGAGTGSSQPLGVGPGSVAVPDPQPDKPRANPLLALRLHRVLLSERITQGIADALKVLFRPVVVTIAVVGLVASDVMLLWGGAMEQSVTAVVTQPILMLAVLGLLLSGTLFHELGHAAGCRYGGDAFDGIP
jgi:putative peptide zinc metalloprotease protein